MSPQQKHAWAVALLRTMLDAAGDEDEPPGRP
jgi:hypothetical protein